MNETDTAIEALRELIRLDDVQYPGPPPHELVNAWEKARRALAEYDRSALDAPKSGSPGAPDEHSVIYIRPDGDKMKVSYAEPLDSSLTTDPTDPALTRGVDYEPRPQSEKYLVLSAEERAKGFVRPVRSKYVHGTCRTITAMGIELAETYARDPSFYGATYCCFCRKHRPVSEFTWVDDNEVVGS